MIDKLVFLENYEILFDKQFGLRSKHHTDHAILSMFTIMNIHLEVFLILERPLIE